MAWQTPKTDWAAADSVRDTDFNRIEGNILELYNADALRSAKTVYVSTSGNDTTGTGSASAPYRTINKALSTIPRNLNGYAATINIAAGTYNEVVNLNGYSGPIILTGSYNTQVAVSGFTVDDCVCVLDEINIVLASVSANVTNGGVLAGSGGIMVSSVATGLNVNKGSRVAITRLNAVSTTSAAIAVDGASHVSISTMSGSDNMVAILVQGGSIVAYGSNNMAAGRVYTQFTGGRVYTGGGTGGSSGISEALVE